MEKELAESCEGAVHSDVKYTSRKTERTRNQNKMEQQNFGQSGQVYYQPPIQLFLQAEVAKNIIFQIISLEILTHRCNIFSVKTAILDIRLSLYSFKTKR